MDTTIAPPTSLPATAPSVPRARSAFAVVVLGWLLPGLGQLYVGRPFKALLMLVAIGGLFYGGLVLTAFTCVNPKTYELEFVAHACLGGPTAAAYYLTRGFELSTALPWLEVGRLYAAVAGLLNVVAICDALGDVIEHNRGVRIQASLRARYLEEREAERQRAIDDAARIESARAEAASREAERDVIAQPAPGAGPELARDLRPEGAGALDSLPAEADLPSFFDDPGDAPEDAPEDDPGKDAAGGGTA